MSSYRLPGGECTSDVNAWSNTWEKLIHKIEQTLQVSVISFDPGMQVRPAGSEFGPATTLPMWIVQRIVNLADKVTP